MLSSGARSGGPAPPLADHPRTYTPHGGRSGNEGSVGKQHYRDRGELDRGLAPDRGGARPRAPPAISPCGGIALKDQTKRVDARCMPIAVLTRLGREADPAGHARSLAPSFARTAAGSARI